MPTIAELLTAVGSAKTTMDSYASDLLSTNTALATANATYNMRMAAFATAVQGGNASAISDAADDLLTANSALGTAESNYSAALALLVTAQQNLAAAQQALNTAIVDALPTVVPPP